MHTPGSKNMCQIFGIVDSLEINITPDTLPRIIFKSLDVDIFPYVGDITEFLIFSWRQKFPTEYMIIL